jgi:flagellar biosynthesis GTPase FlhF
LLIELLQQFIYDVQVIRENQVVVVVGETGSGKTTQLTQVCCRFRCFILLNYVIQSRKEEKQIKSTCYMLQIGNYVHQNGT